MKTLEARIRRFFFFLIKAIDRDQDLTDAQKTEARQIFLELRKLKRNNKLN